MIENERKSNSYGINIWKVLEFFFKYLFLRHEYQRIHSYKNGYYVSIIHIFDYRVVIFRFIHNG